MATTLVFEDRFEMPLNISDLSEFRRWVNSDEFPGTGRVDYLAGRIEVEMSPEELFAHGALKVEVIASLLPIIKSSRSGHLFADSTRVTIPEAKVSTEPDIVFVSRASIAAGRVKLVPKAAGGPGRFVELEGGPDMIAEIVSDASVAKDTRRLPQAYFAAGVREFWLIDARGVSVQFEIHQRGSASFVAVDGDPEGYIFSQVFGFHFRLRRQDDEDGLWEFDLLTRD